LGGEIFSGDDLSRLILTGAESLKLAPKACSIGPMCPPRPPTRHPPTLGEDGGGVACRYARGGTEPTLDELIHEPIIRLLMLRDNVSEKRRSRKSSEQRKKIVERGRVAELKQPPAIARSSPP
jgi:hypothetical protein